MGLQPRGRPTPRGPFAPVGRRGSRSSRGGKQSNILFGNDVRRPAVWCGAEHLVEAVLAEFASEPSRPDVVRFVSVLAKGGRLGTSIPVSLPADGEWYVRLVASDKRFVFGVYRRHMKTIGYLGQVDRLCGVPATTRNWNTIIAITRVLKGENEKVDRPRRTKR